MLTCRLFSQVEVLLDDQRIDLGYPRQRGLLVILLVEVNRLVSVESLIDRVWGQHPPLAARDTLYTDISRLRRALKPTSEMQLIRRSGGYLIKAAPQTVDLHRFRDLVARARVSDTDEERAALLEEGLVQAQGEPFADLNTPWLTDLRASLNREKFNATLDRNDAQLRLGRHTILLTELSTLSAAHPLDERLAAQFMLALYRSGGQSEALHHYQRMRQQLADDLGVDPGPELQDLYQRILRNAAELSTAPKQSASARPPVPRQLPAHTSHFVGRAEELRKLSGVLDTEGETAGTVVISAINGTAGIGKTALALHWAHQAADRFPDGQLYVNLRGFDPSETSMEPAEAIHGFLGALGVPPEGIPVALDARAALYRSLLAERHALVMLDNARDAGQVRPLLPGSPTCAVIVTSRNQLTSLVVGEGAQPISLDLLSVGEGISLLAGHLGPEYVASELETMNELIERCARLPLALAIVAARISVSPHVPLTALVEQLADERTRLDALDTGDPSSSVRAAFSWSYRYLERYVARVFRLLGLHPGPELSVPAVAALAGIDCDDAGSALSVLTKAHLVTELASGRFVLHDLLRVYAVERAEAEERAEDRNAAVRRLLTWYLHSADAADRFLVPRSQRVPLGAPEPGSQPLSFNDRKAALEWCDVELANIVAAIRLAAGNGYQDIAWKLPIVLWGFFTLRKPWTDWIAVHRIGLAAAEESNDLLGQAYVWTALANAYRDLRWFDKAEHGFLQALPIWQAIDNQWGEGAALILLGITYRDSQRFQPALDCLDKSLKIFHEIDDLWGKAWVLHNLGETHQRLRRHEEAIDGSEKALAIFRHINDKWGEGWALCNLGKTHQDLGDFPTAIDHLQHALGVFREIGNRMGEGIALASLGTTLMLTNRTEEARTSLSRALVIFADLGAPQVADIQARLRTLGRG
jgi:DNA-binding SARP family transcriptional activator/tetratricopeptide (TPR) repeat protein